MNKSNDLPFLSISLMHLLTYFELRLVIKWYPSSNATKTFYFKIEQNIAFSLNAIYY